MKSLLASAILAGISAALTGCGTVSHVTPNAGTQMEIEKYERVVVLDFEDGVTPQAKLRDRPRRKAEMNVRTKSFPDRIAIELDARGVFREVVRGGTPDDHTLVLSGVITRYEEGDATLRLMIGMGAGSSYFDARVDFKDGGTSETIASQQVNKNSWALGGGVAATQSPDTFMMEAAVRLADDLASLKRTGKLPAAKPPATTGKGAEAKWK